MMKDIRFAATLLGVAVLIGSCTISNSVSNDYVKTINDLNNNAANETNFELTVDNGFLYMTDTASGEVWKKPDDDSSSWVLLPYLYSDE